MFEINFDEKFEKYENGFSLNNSKAAERIFGH